MYQDREWVTSMYTSQVPATAQAPAIVTLATVVVWVEATEGEALAAAAIG